MTHKFGILITTILAIGLLLRFIGIPSISIWGFLIYLLGNVLVIIYSLTKRELQTKERFLIAGIAICSIVGSLFKLMSWPYAIEIIFISVILSTVYLLMFVNYKSKLNTEFKFMVILIANISIMFINVLFSYFTK